MTETSRTYEEVTLPGIPKSTCSQESEDGRSPSNGQDGLKIDQSGQEAAPVNPSAQQERGKGKKMNATCGPLFEPSSPSAALQSSLESRLRRNLEGRGSPEYVLTWKHWDMESGPPICALRASVRRTSDKGFGGWPTPQAEGVTSPRDLDKRLKGDRQTRTPGLMGNYRKDLADVAGVAGWPTPVSNDDNKTPKAHLRMKQRMGERDGTGANRTAITSLAVMAQTAGWATPQAHDAKGARSEASATKKSSRCLAREANLVGQEPTPPVQTEKRGALNPALSRWLMGFPPEWDAYAPTATPSSRKSRQSS